jgi:hypothetical protein
MAEHRAPYYFRVKASERSVEGALSRFYKEDPYYAAQSWAFEAVTIRRVPETGETEVFLEDTGDQLREDVFRFLRGYYTAMSGKHPWRFYSPWDLPDIACLCANLPARSSRSTGAT